jgi:putative phosphoribosyl transferase
MALAPAVGTLRDACSSMPFRDREEAGQRLAALLGRYRDEAPLVLGLPRGGVPVAWEVARALDAPLDVFVVRKLGAPFQPELGIGAIAEGGIVVLDERAGALGITEADIEAIKERESRELSRRVQRFRGGRPPPDVRGRTVILVDDGIATGGTARAAVRAARELGARRIVLAVAVAPASTVEALAPEVDDLVCVEAPEDLYAIGLWYRDFRQVSDEEVADWLARARRGPGAEAAGEGARSTGRTTMRDMDHGQEVTIATETEPLRGNLAVPDGARGLVLFAHGSGSSRRSPRNRYVARMLRDAGLGTLLFDLLTADEEEIDSETAELRFDIDFLAGRLVSATDWARTFPATRHLRPGYFGASTGAAAALVAAGRRPGEAFAVVSRGGRPDLAGDALPLVRSPTLLIVGGADLPVIRMNRSALVELQCEKDLVIVPGATHLFEEAGALEEVARLAAQWFARHSAEKEEPATI